MMESILKSMNSVKSALTGPCLPRTSIMDRTVNTEEPQSSDKHPTVTDLLDSPIEPNIQNCTHIHSFHFTIQNHIHQHSACFKYWGIWFYMVKGNQLVVVYMVKGV